MTTVMTPYEREMATLELIDRLNTVIDTVAGSVETLSKIVQIQEARIKKLEARGLEA